MFITHFQSRRLAFLVFAPVLLSLFAASYALTHAQLASNKANGDKGFVIQGKKLIVSNGFVIERGKDNTLTVRKFGSEVKTTLACKCRSGATKGCEEKDGGTTPDGGTVTLCGGKDCCDWR